MNAKRERKELRPLQKLLTQEIILSISNSVIFYYRKTMQKVNNVIQDDGVIALAGPLAKNVSVTNLNLCIVQ